MEERQRIADRRLAGKIALVTGGSRGLGRSICEGLALQGASVAVNYSNNRNDAEDTVSIITSHGGHAAAFQADITNGEEVGRLVREAETYFGGPLEILVNNATGPQPYLLIEESNWKDYLDQLDFFVKAPLLLVQAVLGGMKSAGCGSIINIGSEVVQIGHARFSSYVAAKSAMIGMTRSWASELGSSNIRVNLVAPGWIPVERHVGADTEGYRKGVPLQRMGEPNDIANAVVFLASDEAKFITGQCLTVNGGNTYGL